MKAVLTTRLAVAGAVMASLAACELRAHGYSFVTLDALTG